MFWLKPFGLKHCASDRSCQPPCVLPGGMASISSLETPPPKRCVPGDRVDEDGTGIKRAKHDVEEALFGGLSDDEAGTGIQRAQHDEEEALFGGLSDDEDGTGIQRAQHDAEGALFGGFSDVEDDDDDDSDDSGVAVCRRWTPNQLRARIRELLQQTDIKITELHGMLRVNANSYNKFMNGKYKHQWNAAQNSTYDAATRFFVREEKLGKEAVGKIRAKVAAKRASSAHLPDISCIETDGLTDLTPSETRREIIKVLKEFKTSAAQLSRLANTPYQSANLFLKAGGDYGGVDNQAYHPLANLVEKLRSACKKSKSKKRVELEAEVAAGRVQRNGQPFLGADPSGKFLCRPGYYGTIVSYDAVKQLFGIRLEDGRSLLARHENHRMGMKEEELSSEDERLLLGVRPVAEEARQLPFRDRVQAVYGCDFSAPSTS